MTAAIWISGPQLRKRWAMSNSSFYAHLKAGQLPAAEYPFSPGKPYWRADVIEAFDKTKHAAKSPAPKAKTTTTGQVELSSTLRDHFAGLAMQAMLTVHTAERAERGVDFPQASADLSVLSYAMADAMLKARDA